MPKKICYCLCRNQTLSTNICKKNAHQMMKYTYFVGDTKGVTSTIKIVASLPKESYSNIYRFITVVQYQKLIKWRFNVKQNVINGEKSAGIKFMPVLVLQSWFMCKALILAWAPNMTCLYFIVYKPKSNPTHIVKGHNV